MSYFILAARGLELFQHFDGKLGLSKIIGKHKTKGAPLGEITKLLVSEFAVEPMKAEIRKRIAKLQPVLKHKSGEQIKAASWKKGAKALQKKLKIKRKKSFALQDYVIEQASVAQQQIAPKNGMLEKSTIVLMLKNLTAVLKISQTGAKTVLGHSYSDKIIAKIFCLKS
ncbi:MAG: hypothetical protein HY513_02030 [Candidatus Aenigmarchaeota archaeon]|nr:hypothetical protein [Candidatus Aenigmarchaeota archaeon]